MRPSITDERMYLLGAVVADPATCSPARDELMSVKPKSARKLHWTDMEEREKKRVTDLIAEFDMAHMVVIGTPLDHRKQEHARAKCMERLLWELGELQVTQVFLEQRTQSLNKRDMKLVESLRGRRFIPSSLRVNVEQPSTEPMLWIPDQVLGAVGDAEAEDHTWLDMYGGMVQRIDITI
jgi:hypothetical protein